MMWTVKIERFDETGNLGSSQNSSKILRRFYQRKTANPCRSNSVVGF